MLTTGSPIGLIASTFYRHQENNYPTQQLPAPAGNNQYFNFTNNNNYISSMQHPQASTAGGGSSGASNATNFLYGYSADRPQLGLDVEFGADPASGAFFQTDGRKHDDLKQMLDSNKDSLKLEAMKRIIGMIARGRDAGDLFPAVVKNVVSKNIEVKKLVYVYLVRYAEEQQDLALLSISTFQRALKDPNQLIRASALRVLSSIRVNMIVPIVMLAIRDSASDMSPYVRKTAAHAIPKLYSLDAEQKDELVMVIDKLLSDRTTLVVGSAVMAFDEVCPERVDLIHKNYRKLCNLLVDVDEWGQIIIINMLTRYARTQFVDPNADEPKDDTRPHNAEVPFYEESAPQGSVSASSSSSSSSYGSSGSEEETNSDSEEVQKKEKSNKKKIMNKAVKKPAGKTGTSTSTPSRNAVARAPLSPASSYHPVDLDHRLLLRQTKPLLQSRNASVVMSVAQLYHHVAPRSEVQLIAKALIRLLRSHKEVQSVVLTCIASMSTRRKSIFEPHIKTFFVRTSDPTHIKLLKLDILTNLASASSIPLILREFQTYISSSDRSFVAATIQAIGRCAASIKEVTETCLSGLVQLLSNRDEHVVAESVIVIKKLLQTKHAEHFEIIAQMAKLLDYITVPAARASIVWLIGEYNEKVPLIAPDVLRKMAKTFVDEENSVKLQVLNLCVKLFLTNQQQTSLLVQYVFTLARYDPNYDVRDRSRTLRQFIFPASGKNTVLSQKARNIFLAPKPAPALESKYRDRDHFQLGSLSHYLNMRAVGYVDLPTFPTSAPDSSVRNIEGFIPESSGSLTSSVLGGVAEGVSGNKKQQKHSTKTTNNSNDKNFLSGSEKSSAYTSSDSESDSDSDSDSDEKEETSSQEIKNSVKKVVAQKAQKKSPSKENTESTAQIHLDVNNGNGSATSDSETSSYSSSDSNSSGDEEYQRNNVHSDSENELEQHHKTERANEKAQPHKKDTNNDTVEQTPKTPEKSNLDLLLDLDDIPPIGPVMTPSLGGFLTPGNPMMGTIGLVPQNANNRVDLVGPSFIEFKYKELLNKLTGHSLQVNYRFTRSPHLYSAAMVSIELQFINHSSEEITGISMGQHKTLSNGMSLNEFAPIQQLQPQQSQTSVMGVDFNDSTHAIEFEIISSVGAARVNLKAPVGELVRSVQINESFFKEERTKLRGMNEHQSRLALRKEKVDFGTLKQTICECINVMNIRNTANPTNECLYYVGQTMSSKSLVLITLDWSTTEGEELSLMVNCEKMVIGSMVLNELRNALTVAFV